MNNPTGNKTQLSFRQQILLSFSVCILLFALLGALSTGWMATKNIGQALLEQGVQVTKSFSKQALFPLLYGDEEGLKEAAAIILGFPGITHAAIYNKGGERLHQYGEMKEVSIAITGNLRPFSPALLEENENEWRLVTAVYDGVLDDSGDSPFVLERTKPELIGYVGVSIDKTSLHQLRRTIFIENLIGVFCFALIFLFLLMKYIRQMTQPLDALASLMRKAESGDASVRSTLSGSSEINNMSRAFNTMIQSLDERTQNLEIQKVELQSEIEERLSVQRSLIDRETHLSTVIENVADGILIISSSGIIESANSVGKGIFQFSKNDIEGLHYQSLFFDSDYDLGESPNHSHREVIGLRKDAEQFPLDLAVSDMVLAGNRKFIVICRDITEQKKRELAFSQLFAKLQAIMGSVPGVLFQIDKASRLSWWNQMIETCSRLSPEQLTGKVITDLFLASDREHIDQMFDRAFIENYCEFQANILTANGAVPYQLRIVRIEGGAESDATLIGVGLDISTQIAAQETLQQARDAALEAVRLKSEFLANMSHEIRTPLNGLLGMLQLLATTPLNKEQVEFSDIAQRSGDALLTIINEVLDFSKIEAGKIELEHIEYNINQLVDDVAGLYSPKARDKGIDVTAVISNNVPTGMVGDPTRIRQVLSNLVDNAIKFTEAGGVVVRVSYDERRRFPLQIRISDTGCGIPNDAQAKIFDSFVQADGSATRKFGGTGLGLAIVKQLVEIMGGELSLQSETAKGSTFTLHLLPELTSHTVAQVPPPSLGISALAIGLSDVELDVAIEYFAMFGIVVNCLAAIPEGAISKKSNIFVFNHCSFEAYRLTDFSVAGVCILGDGGHTDVGLKPSGNHVVYIQKPIRKSIFERQIGLMIEELTGFSVNIDSNSEMPELVADKIIQRSADMIKILVAEDNEINQLLVTKMLDRMGYQTDIANNGLEAIALAESHQYDLILMDCQMPELDGYEATKAIRKLPLNSSVPIVAITGNALPEDVEKCQKYGLNDHLSKPFKYSQLQKVLEKWLNV